MNAVIAGARERAARDGARAIGVRGGFAGLAECRAMVIDEPEALAHLYEPGTWLGTSRWPELRFARGRDACLRSLDRLELEGLLVIGGEGSSHGARALARALPTAFVPATIDRDVEGTQTTVGSDSAIAYACNVIDRLCVTGRSLPGRAFVVQTLGAPTGHLAESVAAAAGIADVLVPERPYDLDAIAGRLAERAPSGGAIVVISEAVGDAVAIGQALATRSGLRVHPTILGHAQRAATPSAFDSDLGQAAGRAALEALVRAESSFVALGTDGTVSPEPLRGIRRPYVVN